MQLSIYLKKHLGFLTVDDLPKSSPDIRKLREQTKILIIDDEDFQYENTLRSSGFNIKVEKEWHDTKDVASYDIVVSDNNGVAKNLGEQTGGLYMLRQAQKLYPEKVYVIYSASFIDTRNNDTKGLITISKSDKPEDWSDILDESISRLHSFKEIWEKTRSILVELDISEKAIRKIQHRYVRSVINRKEIDRDQLDLGINIETISLLVRIINLAVSAAKLLPIT